MKSYISERGYGVFKLNYHSIILISYFHELGCCLNLEAGPTIPFPNFSKLFKTWLEVLSTITEEQRSLMFSSYINEISTAPQKLINFNLDGILEIFLSLDNSQKNIIVNSIHRIISNLDESKKKKLFLIIPENAKKVLGF